MAYPGELEGSIFASLSLDDGRNTTISVEVFLEEIISKGAWKDVDIKISAHGRIGINCFYNLLSDMS
jgi:hypothetical protein